jgi:hypothetical protein
MNVEAERSESSNGPATSWAARALMVGGLLSLLVAGLVLWSDRGAAVFNETVLAAIAWCF